jgi:hypothetical protein
MFYFILPFLNLFFNIIKNQYIHDLEIFLFFFSEKTIYWVMKKKIKRLSLFSPSEIVNSSDFLKYCQDEISEDILDSKPKTKKNKIKVETQKNEIFEEKHDFPEFIFHQDLFYEKKKFLQDKTIEYCGFCNKTSTIKFGCNCCFCSECGVDIMTINKNCPLCELEIDKQKITKFFA